MTYTYTASILLESVKKEISRFAASAHGEDGSPLYDAYKISSRDEETVEGYISDAVDNICVRLFDVAKPSDGSIVFDVPDYDSSMTSSVIGQLDRFVVMRSCASWLGEKGAPEYERYEKRAMSALDNAHILIKSRKAPKRS